MGSIGPMTVIAMSRTEIDRMSVLHDLADGRIRIAEASTLMGLGRRQVFPLTKAYGEHGPQVLVSRRRGRPSNRCYPTALGSGAADFWLFPAGTIWRPGRNDPWSSGRFLGSRRTGRDSTRWGDGTFVSSARRARPCAIDPSLATDSDLRSRMATAEQHPSGLGYGRKSPPRWFLSIRKQLLSLEPAALGFWHPNSRAPSAAALQEAWR